jgi:hypothetical protein
MRGLVCEYRHASRVHFRSRVSHPAGQFWRRRLLKALVLGKLPLHCLGMFVADIMSTGSRVSLLAHHPAFLQ